MIQDTGGTCPKTWSAGPLVQKIGQPFLGSVPLVPVSQILAGCFLRRRLQDWSCYSNTNSPAQTETKWAAHRRLLDWSWSQQNQEKPKGQLSGDCLTGLGPNRNGENQQQLTGDCSTSFGHSTQREDNQPWQLSGDCLTGLGPNRNGKNQKAAHRRLLDQFWSLNPKGRQSTLDTAWSRGAEGVVM